MAHTGSMYAKIQRKSNQSYLEKLPISTKTHTSSNLNPQQQIIQVSRRNSLHLFSKKQATGYSPVACVLLKTVIEQY